MSPLTLDLFYNSRCPPCLRLSRLAVILGLTTVRRVPLQSDEGLRLQAEHPHLQGRLVLRDGERLVVNLRVYAALPLLVPWVLLRRLKARLLPAKAALPSR